MLCQWIKLVIQELKEMAMNCRNAISTFREWGPLPRGIFQGDPIAAMDSMLLIGAIAGHGPVELALLIDSPFSEILCENAAPLGVVRNEPSSMPATSYLHRCLENEGVLCQMSRTRSRTGAIPLPSVHAQGLDRE